MIVFIMHRESPGLLLFYNMNYANNTLRGKLHPVHADKFLKNARKNKC